MLRGEELAAPGLIDLEALSVVRKQYSIGVGSSATLLD